jgi:hypothetical protein
LADVILALDPPQPCLVHSLARAPTFVGRAVELQKVRNFWNAGRAGVLALVGLGGAGKTAVAASFLEEHFQQRPAAPAGGVFVWSFYIDPDPERFLQEACRYFGADAPPAKGVGLLHLLQEAMMGAAGPHLLVLDGLERVQEEASQDNYGRIEDPILRAFLMQIGQGGLPALALVTSRFPLSDLQTLGQSNYQCVEIGGLPLSEALSLLRQRGVRGEETTLRKLVQDYGSHALTLDHLASLLVQFFDGDPLRAPELPPLAETGTDRQALRLARLLRSYEANLPAEELALVCQLSLLRHSATQDQIQQLFLCEPSVHVRTIRQIGEAIERLPGDLQTEELCEDLSKAIVGCLEEALCSAPIAGPAGLFRQELHAAAVSVLDLLSESFDADYEQLAHIYAYRKLEPPTDERPLSIEDREELPNAYRRYLELRHHPSMPFKNPDSVMKKALSALGGKKIYWRSEEMSSGDVLRQFRAARQRLQYLTGKHFALRRVRQLCRTYQQKHSLAGPLAALDSSGFQKVLKALVDRHLVLDEGEGKYSVHPAVRDHFARLSVAKDYARAWHDLIREQMIQLCRRPGLKAIEGRTLDLVEEAIHHALEAGRVDEAIALYNHELGGVRHLGWKLGEMSRGQRILRQFDPCPEAWDLAWYLRALGEYEEAYGLHPPAFFRADLRLLQGRLPEVAAEGDDGRTAVADFLMGRMKTAPGASLGHAVPRAQLFLYQGRLDAAKQAASLDQLYEHIGWEGERARHQLLLAEIARRQADDAGCQSLIQAASRWILHAGSVEHLSLLFLVRARQCRRADAKMALHQLDEGIRLARQYGLGLCQIELVCEKVELLLSQGDTATAELLARDAFEHATALSCQFAWGAVDAGYLLGRALVAQQRFAEANELLKPIVDVGCNIQHPRGPDIAMLFQQCGAAIS